MILCTAFSSYRDDFSSWLADAYVVAAGSYTTALMRQVGVSVPIYPGKGYSATLKILKPELAAEYGITASDAQVVDYFGEYSASTGAEPLEEFSEAGLQVGRYLYLMGEAQLSEDAMGISEDMLAAFEAGVHGRSRAGRLEGASDDTPQRAGGPRRVRGVRRRWRVPRVPRGEEAARR